MIRNLYLNEELIISLTKENQIVGVIKKEFLAKKVNSMQLQFVKDSSNVMEKLKEGQDLELTTNGTIVTSSIDGTVGRGYSVPSSIVNLDDKLGAKRM